jgi:hypothetical protein
MKEFIFLSKSPELRYSNEKITLPKEIVEKIETYWKDLIDSGKTFRRGDVFTITNIKNENDDVQIDIALTDYAHYLATINGIIGEEYACRVAHSSVMIESNDGNLIFGEMASNTALPGRIQCIGGGITREDLAEDGKSINMEKNAKAEMAEEVGLFAENKDQVQSFLPWAIVESGPQKAIGIVYWAKIAMDLNQFLEHYKAFEKSLKEKGENPELSKIVHVSKTVKNKEAWFQEMKNPIAEYIPIIFRNL